ncbi:LysR family transcriptional regulator [Shewanella mangrovisoli]|uniref:LysR family transcriptional regulator n=1 Tax=Shewanella mangrovisoli TaxID=2864211 RepID=UPI0035B7358B
MTLVQLRHLIALAETGSFRRAAEIVNLTQSALTRSIQSLEEDLGERLFERIGRRTELTPFGHSLLIDSQRLVLDADHLKARANAIRTGKAGSINIGMGPLPSRVLTVPLLKYMATHHPGVQVQCHLDSTNLMIQSLREHRLDALVVATHFIPLSKDLRIEPIAVLRGGAFMCRKGHPLLARKTLSFNELTTYPMAALTMLNDRIAQFLVEKYGPHAHPDECMNLRSNQFEPLIEMVKSSDAILFAVRSAAPELEVLQVKPVLSDSGIFGLVTLDRCSTNPLLPTIRDLFTQIFKSLE